MFARLLAVSTVLATLLVGCGDFTSIGNSPHTSRSSYGDPEDDWSSDERVGPGPSADWTATPIDGACQVRSRTYAIGEMTASRYRVRGSFAGSDRVSSAIALRFTLLDHGAEVGSFAVVRDAKHECTLDVRDGERREATERFFDHQLANVFDGDVAFDEIRVDAIEPSDAALDANPVDALDFARAL